MLIIYVLAFIAIFYFMAIRPQQRQRRAHQALLSSLKKGDHVITAAGIYGTVKRVEENLVVVEVAKGVQLKVARRAISEIVRDTAAVRAFTHEPSGSRRGGKKAPRQIEEEVPVVEETVEEEEYYAEEAAEEAIAEAEEEEMAAYEEEAAEYYDEDVVVEDEEAAADEDESERKG